MADRTLLDVPVGAVLVNHSLDLNITRFDHEGRTYLVRDNELIIEQDTELLQSMFEPIEEGTQ